MYNKINWNTTDTPISPANLNKMDGQYDQLKNDIRAGFIPIVIRRNPSNPVNGEIFFGEPSSSSAATPPDDGSDTETNNVVTE